MKPSRICVAWQNKSSPWPSSGRMKPKPLWFQATQTPVLRGPPSPPNSPRLRAPPASRAPGLRERRGGLRERGRGSSRRGGLRSAIFVCCAAGRLSSERRCDERAGLAAVKRCRRRLAAFRLRAPKKLASCNTLALSETLERHSQRKAQRRARKWFRALIRLRGTPTKHSSHRCRLASQAPEQN